jgi:hypothetical protein
VKATLLALSIYADADGRGAFPSAERLGRDLGKSERWIRADLAAAVDAGYLSRRRENRQKTYRYRLTRPDVSVRSEDESSEEPDRTSASAREVPTGRQRPVATGRQRPDTKSEDQARGNEPYGLVPAEDEPFRENTAAAAGGGASAHDSEEEPMRFFVVIEEADADPFAGEGLYSLECATLAVAEIEREKAIAHGAQATIEPTAVAREEVDER